MLLFLTNSSEGSSIKASAHASITLEVVCILIDNGFVKEESKSLLSHFSRFSNMGFNAVGSKYLHPARETSYLHRLSSQ